jgi:phosphotransacetylase
VGDTVARRFLIVLPDSGLFAYADAVVIPGPEQAQLPDIALCASRMCADLTGRTPVVAMLSFSANGSAEHPAVTGPAVADAGARRGDGAGLQAIGNR